MNIISILNKYKYCSFDLFDTLVKRNIDKPKDIFDIVQNEYNKNNKKIYNFREKRIQAEKKARLNCSSEINIAYIYKYLSEDYDKVVAQKLRKIEENVELDFCQINNDNNIKLIYDEAIKNDKKIIIITDIYLEQKLIKKILEKCKIKYDYLFVSSSLQKTKSKGDLFDYVVDNLNISLKDVIHFGDNIHSDYKVPKSKGITAIHIKEFKKIKKRKKEIEKDLNYNIFSSFISNNINNNSYYYKFGYNSLGILIFCFTNWIIYNLKKEKINKIFFLSRDGLILKKAFDIINKDEKIVSKYLFASRRSLIVPSLWKYNTIEEMLESISFPSKNISIKDILKKLGLESSNFIIKLKKYNLDLESKVNVNNIKRENSNVKFFLKDIYDEISKNSKEEYNNLNTYLIENNFTSKLAIVDIGWYGTMQKALMNIIDNLDMHGFYIGLSPKRKKLDNINGYLFDVNKNEDLFQKEHCFNALFEFIFSTTHGSVKRFFNDNIEFYDYEYEGCIEKKILEEIQHGALDFVIDFNKSNLVKYVDCNPRVALINIFNIFLNPTLNDIEHFKNIRFKDIDFEYIINPQKNYKYFLNLKSLFKDYKKSFWKIGFLKKIFVIPFPYYYIDKILKKICNKI